MFLLMILGFNNFKFFLEQVSNNYNTTWKKKKEKNLQVLYVYESRGELFMM